MARGIKGQWNKGPDEKRPQRMCGKPVPAAPRSPLTSGPPCRCGSASTCLTHTAPLSTESPSPQPAHHPWAGLPRGPRRGTPGCTFLWANQSSRSCSKTNPHVGIRAERERKPGAQRWGSHLHFLAQIPSPVTWTKLMVSISACELYAVQLKARVSALWPRGQKRSCSFQSCFQNPKLRLQRLLHNTEGLVSPFGN